MNNIEFLYKELNTLKKEQNILIEVFENKINTLNQIIEKYQQNIKTLNLENVTNKIYLYNELERLEQEKKELIKEFQNKISIIEQNINKYQIQVEQLELEMVDSYKKFFLKYKTRDLMLIDDFPNLKTIESYYSTNFSKLEKHPIWNYGYFDIKELAEVIRVLYYLQQQKKFQILTMCCLQKNENFLTSLNLYFLIGSEEQLEQYQKYKNKIIKVDNIDFFIPKTKELITLVQNFNFESELETNFINLMCDNFNNKINIFSSNMIPKLLNYEGIHDTLSFKVHASDKFLAELLISIAIYKKNRNTSNLTNDDYRYIFQKIFREYFINIEQGIEQNIPKTLKYTPNN